MGSIGPQETRANRNTFGLMPSQYGSIGPQETRANRNRATV